MAASDGRAGRPWRRIREQILARDPYCTIRGPRCKGISTTVDHIIPMSKAPELAHDVNNLRGACGPCNYRGGARITNSRRGGLLELRRPTAHHNPMWCTKDGPLGCICTRATPHGY